MSDDFMPDGRYVFEPIDWSKTVVEYGKHGTWISYTPMKIWFAEPASIQFTDLHDPTDWS